MRDPLLRRAGIALATAAPIVAGVAVLAASVKYQPYGIPESRRDEYREIMRAAEEVNAVAAKPDVARTDGPVVAVEKTEHDFGMMDPMTEASHDFVIRNAGTEVLRLITGETSCTCTLSKVNDYEVPPGEETTITLTWNSGRNREFYRQYAVIRTNDPRQPEIELAIRGSIRSEFAASVQEIAFPDMDPGEETVRKIAVFSQTWNSFDVGQISTDVDDLTWSVAPLTTEELDQLQAKSGFAVSVQVSGDRPAGYFSGILRLQPVPNEDSSVASELLTTSSEEAVPGQAETTFPVETSEAPDPLEVSVRGKVLLPISLYGPAVHAIDGIRIGSVPVGESKSVKSLIKVRTENPPSYLKVGAITPDFLKANIAETAKPGFYELLIEVPADSPQVNFSGELAGEMTLESDVLQGGQMKVGIEGDTMGKPDRISRYR